MHPTSGGDSPTEISSTPLMNGGQIEMNGFTSISDNPTDIPAKMPPQSGRVASSTASSSENGSFDLSETGEQFFGGLFLSLANSPDIESLAKSIMKINEFINKYRSTFLRNLTNLIEILKFMFNWTSYCVTEPDVSTASLDDSLTNFFLGIIQLLCTLKDNQSELEKKVKIGNAFTIEFITDASSQIVSRIQASTNITQTAQKTLPLALNTLYIIGNYSHDFLELRLLYRHIIIIANRLATINIPIANSPDWVELCTRIHYCVDVYRWIEQQNNITTDELQELTCNLVEHGLMGGACLDYDLDIFPSINRHFVTEALKVMAANFNRDSSQEDIESRNFFSFFQKEISEILVDYAIKTSHSNPTSVLLEGMTMFGISGLIKELLRWALPPFMVLRNEKTEALLNGIAKFTQKPLKIAFENHFNDILIYIFFNCPNDDPIRLTYEVFLFASRASGQDLFPLLNDPALTGRFMENCLKHYCVNANRSFLAISFMCELIPMVHLDPARPDALLEVPTDRMNQNPAAFRNNIEFRFINYMHRVDTRIIRNQDTPEDKRQLIESYAQILRFLGAQFIEKFKIKIYYTIRTLFKYYSKGDKKQLQTVCRIMEEFVSGTKTEFIQAELPSMCFLILQLAKKMPQGGFNASTGLGEENHTKPFRRFDEHCGKVFDKIFRRNHYFPKQIYHQLYFMNHDSTDLTILTPIYEFIRLQTGNITYTDQSPIFDVTIDLVRFVDFIKSFSFGAICREIIFVLDHVNYDDTKIQELSMRQLYHVLNLNMGIFNQLLYARREELRFYEDLSEIPLMLLPDGQDGDNQYVPAMMKLLQSIETVGDFFRTLVMHLLRCLKFATGERAELVANCLGLLGAIDGKFLAFDKPCLMQSYKQVESNSKPSSQRRGGSQVQHHEVDVSIASIDFCNHHPFHHQTREFKQIILECLMKITKRSLSTTDFTYASLGIQELMDRFTNAPQSLIIDKDLKPIDDDGNIDGAVLEIYVAKMFAKGSYSSTSSGEDFRSKEERKVGLIDDLVTVLKNEKVQCIRKNLDLSRELYEYSLTLEAATGMYERKRIDSGNAVTMEQFFGQINPAMSYNTFLKQFLRMLFHCFIMEHSKQSDGTERANLRRSKHMDFCQIFSQHPGSASQHSMMYSTQNTQEYALIMEKLRTIQTPLEVFEVCYHSIFCDDLKLAHLLLPSLIILAISSTDSKTLEKFASHFRSMIRDKFLLNGQFFVFELGPMASELICFIYDYLVEFDKNRKMAHAYVVPSMILRNRVHRFDAEYSSVSKMLEFINSMDVARLAYAANAFDKAMYYLEITFTDMRDTKVSKVALNAFLQENLEFMTCIFAGLGDDDSVKGCQRLRKALMPTLEEMLNAAVAEKDSLGALMIGAQLVRNDHRHSKEKPTIEHFDAQNKYFAAMQELHLDISLCASRLVADSTPENPFSSKPPPSTLWSSKVPMYMIDATWKLNQWDEMDPIINSLHFFGGIPNSEFSKFEQNRTPPKKKTTKRSRLSFGSDSSPSFFAPNIGHALLSLKNEEALFVFQSKLNDIRNSALAPLKAALLSNQHNAYQRAYLSSIIPLHLIHDVQQFSQTIYEKLIHENSSQSSMHGQFDEHEDIIKCFKELKAGWEARNRILPLASSGHSDTVMEVLDVQRALVKILQQHCQKKFSENAGSSTTCSDLYALELFRYWAKGLSAELECGHLDRAYVNMLEAIRLRGELLQKGKRSFLLDHEELAQFVMDSAKVQWCRRNDRAALLLLKSELEHHYADIKQICCMETAKYSLAMNNEPELMEIVNALALKIPVSATRINLGGNSIPGTSRAVCGNSTQFSQAPTQEKAQKQLEKVDSNRLKVYGQLQLQYARYAEESREFSSTPLLAAYKAVNVACPKWEEGHYAIAQFWSNLVKEYERMMMTKIDSQTNYVMCKPEEIIDMKSRIIRAYAESLKHGCQFVSVSLPMMLNTWLELGYEERAFAANSNISYMCNIVRSSGFIPRLKDAYKRSIDIATTFIRELSTTANNAIFLPVVDTLITHFMHPHNGIAECILEILAKLYADFPHYMAWQLSRSSLQSSKRGYIAKEIHSMAIKIDNQDGINLAKYHTCFRIFTNCINELSRYKPAKIVIQSTVRRSGPPSGANSEFSLRRLFPQLIKSVESLNDGLNFMMPSNKLFLPSMLNLERTSNRANFNHFFCGLLIEKLEDQAQAMKSLQMPKKITFICQDGVKRMLLCKSQDDLRKDRCFLNFANLFNQCYGGEIPKMESMRRTVEELKADDMTEEKIRTKRRLNPLKLQTYNVCPLNDSFGIIEWIPGLVPLKVLIEGQYNRTRLSKNAFYQAKNIFVKNVYAGKVTREKRIDNYIQSLPSFTPPVFHMWFRLQFADPFSWAMAKRNFTRSSAVYSVLGYILGLGDRHSENLLIDPSTGEVVQVDFNCLFNRGEEFVVPECVPFRLTHNMVAVMGLVGFEGQFRHTAEDVLFILRQYRKLFAKHVTMFLYDPLQEWLESSERNELREKSVFGVEARLAGIISRSSRHIPKGKPVSVAGQIDYIINEATNPNNLGAMYHGWAPYI